MSSNFNIRPIVSDLQQNIFQIEITREIDEESKLEELEDNLSGGQNV